VYRTLDHSYVQTLVDRGEISAAEASFHPQANILMGCLGAEKDPPVAHHFIPRLKPGDILMACSDGLWHYFSDLELGSVLSNLSPRDASEFLIEKARARAKGIGDNLSLVIIKLDPLQSPESEVP
jgi:serine/threonine protein phosphatase PrpC